MKPFEELTERGQIRRLRRLAQAALSQFGLGAAQLSFIAYSENAVFCVEPSNKPAAACGRDAPRERSS